MSNLERHIFVVQWMMHISMVTRRQTISTLFDDQFQAQRKIRHFGKMHGLSNRMEQLLHLETIL